MRQGERKSAAGYRILLAVLFLTAPSAALAATVVVAPGEVVIDNNGVCSLREAIINANEDSQAGSSDCPAGSGDDIIVLAGGSTYSISNEFQTYGSGLPEITSGMTIQGNGATIKRADHLSCNLDGIHDPGEFRIFAVYGDYQAGAGGDLRIYQATIENGCADGGHPDDDGGAIYVGGGRLELSDVTLRGNEAQDKSGGIDNTGGEVLIVDSTIAQNRALGGGGGVGNGSGEGSTMMILRSTITENSASGDGGGGIGNLGSVDLINSTISGNTASGTGGGGIGSFGILRIASSTIFGNTAAVGGGIGNGGSAEIRNTLVAGNAATGIPEMIPMGGGGIANLGSLAIGDSIVAGNTNGGDCVNTVEPPATFTALGANLDSDGTCPDFVAQTTLAALALGPLAANGGPTRTHALGTGSVALDAAPSCVSVDGVTAILEDQRGVRRPQNAICDIGAYELRSTAAPIPALGALGGFFTLLALMGLAARRLGS